MLMRPSIPIALIGSYFVPQLLQQSKSLPDFIIEFKNLLVSIKQCLSCYVNCC